MVSLLWYKGAVPLYLYVWGPEVECVISESCYKGTILKRSYRKMTVLWVIFRHFPMIPL